MLGSKAPELVFSLKVPLSEPTDINEFKSKVDSSLHSVDKALSPASGINGKPQIETFAESIYQSSSKSSKGSGEFGF